MRLLAPLALALAALPAAAQRPDVHVGPAEIAALVRAHLDRAGIPAGAVAVVRSDTVLFAEGFGEAPRAVAPETPFLIGSMSKSFTALAAVRLALDGRLDLDAPVARYLPDFRLADGEPAGRITVRHLLGHRSRLPRAAGMDPRAARGETGHLRLAFAPGEAFGYSNLNYALLGRVMEAAAAHPFAEVMRAEVAEPLGLTHTAFRRADAERIGLAQGSQRLFFASLPIGEPEYDEASTPAGFIAASAADVGRLLMAHLRAYRDSTSAVVTPEAAALLHTPPAGERYALGWSRGTWSGPAGDEPLLWHTGAVGAYSSAMFLLPERDLAAVVLTGLNVGIIQDPANDLALALLGAADGEAPPPPFPLERILRAAILAGGLWGLWTLTRAAHAWRRAGRPVRIARPVLVRLVVGLAVSAAIVPSVTTWFEIPLPAMLKVAPDLGWALVVGAVATGAETLLGAFTRSVAAEVA